jgi:hypothetical protein
MSHDTKEKLEAAGIVVLLFLALVGLGAILGMLGLGGDPCAGVTGTDYDDCRDHVGPR